MNWYLDALKKSFVFEGRSNRRAFWFFQLIDKLIMASYWGICSSAFPDSSMTAVAIGLFYLLLTLPARAALLCRRLNDNGVSQVNSFWTLLPFVGTLFWAGFGVWPGVENKNTADS